MNDIIELLKERGKAMEIYDIADALKLTVNEVNGALLALTEAGAVAQTKKGKYALPSDMGVVAAKMLAMKNSAPYGRPLSGGRDLKIRKRNGMRPMSGDTVLLRPIPNGDNEPGECELIAITHRANETFLAVLSQKPVLIEEPVTSRRRGKRKRGVLERQEIRFTARPVDPRLHVKIEIEGGLRGGRVGDVVLLRVTGWPEAGVMLRARVERVMGEADDLAVRLSGIALNHGFTESFPEDVLCQAEALSRPVSDEDIAGRTDLRGMTLFTIDGEDAQDFDDAVSLTVKDGCYLLGVHIADVAHYVAQKTPVDIEAQNRGTSVYLPGLTLPMLPEPLSNGVCSLQPNVDRLAMSLQMKILDGKVIDHELTPSVIHSSARLTYEQVNRMLKEEENDVPESLADTLREMNGLAKQLRLLRRGRGSIDFDIPEPAFALNDQGRPTDVFARNRGDAERMIEDFMLLANEVVARMAMHADLPFIYRVHPRPSADRIQPLYQFLAALGIKVRVTEEPRPSFFQKILLDVEDRPEAGLIKQVMLRSLTRAEYSPSPEGHFGLATADYCHFTSPIRRYPDLIAHRILKLFLSGAVSQYAKFEKRMPELAEQSSTQERRAALAERDADDLLKALYMEAHIGEAFEGIVTHVTAWGVYVTLENTVEGLVSVRALSGDYTPDEGRHQLICSGRKPIRLGDRMAVVVERVNTALSQIDFLPI